MCGLSVSLVDGVEAINIVMCVEGSSMLVTTGQAQNIFTTAGVAVNSL